MRDPNFRVLQRNNSGHHIPSFTTRDPSRLLSYQLVLGSLGSNATCPEDAATQIRHWDFYKSSCRRKNVSYGKFLVPTVAEFLSGHTLRFNWNNDNVYIAFQIPNRPRFDLRFANWMDRRRIKFCVKREFSKVCTAGLACAF